MAAAAIASEGVLAIVLFTDVVKSTERLDRFLTHR
jgi:hypothetical protein